MDLALPAPCSGADVLSATVLIKPSFSWQSSDGSEVTAQVLPLGYAIGKYLPADETDYVNASTVILTCWKKRQTQRDFAAEWA